MLFLEEGQTLPIIGLTLPLLPFFVIAPAFYFVLHVYMLMMLVLLARTAKAFNDALTLAPGMVDADREKYRLRLENALFLQIIVGARRERAGANGIMLQAIALVTLAIAPVLVLLLFQLMFLPYHSQPITWWHRALVVADLAAVWTLWPAYRREWGERLLPRPDFWSLLTKTLWSATVILFSVGIATFPTERLHGIVQPRWLAGALFGASYDASTASMGGYPHLWKHERGLFPNRLFLPNEDFVDDDKLKRLLAESISREGRARPAYMLDLRGRDLATAVLDFTDLRNTNAEGTDLRGTHLDGAWLQGSNFGFARMTGFYAVGAQFQGANMLRARMEGAWLNDASFQGALLRGAHVSGASLSNTSMEGVSLAFAHLQGARLSDARVDGADLYAAQLQGANLDRVVLRAVWLERTNVWRAQGVGSVKASMMRDLDHREHPDAFRPNLKFAEWLEEIESRFLRDSSAWYWAAEQQLSTLEPKLAESAIDSSTSGVGFWAAHEAKFSPGKGIDRELTHEVWEIVCRRSPTPFVVRGIFDHGIGRHLKLAEARALVDALRTASKAAPDKETECPVGRDLTPADFNLLEGTLRHIARWGTR
ncbi:MAG: pentapeptide repeat-containing protein [Enhydrobacter sp.]|nr:MAG: pentapeptide repeat-containing protein [Enhydrobacter sp.]